MTERFKTPEPSEGAVLEFNAAWNNPHLRQTDWLLRAFQADVPRIVRAEVERALDVVANRAAIGPEEQRRHERFADAYLRERFGEECQHDYLPGQRVCGKCHTTPTERREPTFIPGIGGGQFISEFTPEDRDRLAKLERFVRVWAKWQTLEATTEDMRLAAREYLR